MHGRELKHDTLSRFAFLELIVQWEGRLTANHLMDKFELSRSSASAVINEYKEIHPQLIYDNSLKGHRPDTKFHCHYSSGTIGEYLTQTANLSQSSTGLEHLSGPYRPLSPELVRPILRACREQRRLDIGYMSLTSPVYEERIIVPHTLVFDGLRYHVRAWCEKRQDYLDFVLSRFAGEFDILDTSPHGKAGDTRWNKMVEISFQPDLRLTPEQQQVVATEYQMQNLTFSFTTRAALVNYQLRRLRLDISDPVPEAQQIMLTRECRQALKPYLPK